MADAVLKARLETLLVRELACEYTHINRVYFTGALTQPQIAIVPSRTHLGRWLQETRSLEISRPLILEQPWGAVIEVLKHEIAHQYVHEILGETTESPHGPAFRATCARLGIDAAASGVPRVQPEQAKIVEKIARLLALAESPNQHEAEAAAAQAQRLMLKHNLDVRKDARGYGYRHLGAPNGRVTESERLLAMILGRHFFVEVIWIPVYRPLDGKRGSVLEVCGTPAN